MALGASTGVTGITGITGITGLDPIFVESGIRIDNTTLATGSHVVESIPSDNSNFRLIQGTTLLQVSILVVI